jgi:GNAT superfamily N-acetyltransferase
MELVWQENICRENRGWIVDQVSAIIDGGIVGYLKVENIPLVEFHKWYGSIFDYVDKIVGRSFNCSNRAPDIKSLLTKEDLIRANQSWFHNDVDASKSFEELLLETECLLKNRYLKEFSNFRKHHVDNPFPAFVRVNPEHRRKGIALVLYQEAARYYAKKGLVLRSSTCITKEAKTVWEKMESLGWVRWDKKHNYYRFYNGQQRYSKAS